MQSIDISNREQIRIEHKIYNDHEGVDARMWVILKGETDFTPTQQGFWLPMDKASEVLKALAAEIAQPVEGTDVADVGGSIDEPYRGADPSVPKG